MHEELNDVYAPSFWEKVMMWWQLRKMIRITKRSIRHAHLTMKLYQSLAQRYSGEDTKKQKAEIDLKYGQLEASAMAEERSLRILQAINLNDPELYTPVRE